MHTFLAINVFCKSNSDNGKVIGLTCKAVCGGTQGPIVKVPFLNKLHDPYTGVGVVMGIHVNSLESSSSSSYLSAWAPLIYRWTLNLLSAPFWGALQW
jgi:hypothetical protein